MAMEHGTDDEGLSRFFALSPDLLCVAGFDGYFKRLNPAWERTLGLTSEELRARPYIEFVHPDDHAGTIEAAQKLAAGIDVVYFANRYLRKDGAYRWLAWTASQSIAEGRIYAVARDITDIKRAEEAVSEEGRARLAALVESSAAAIVGEDLDGTVLSWNVGAERLYGYTANQIIGRNVSLLIAPDRRDESLAILARIRKGEPIDPYETVHLRKDGRAVDVSISGSPIRMDGQITGASTIAQNITERKRAAFELVEANQRVAEAMIQLKQAQSQLIEQERLSALGQMASGIAHDFNNSLSAILGYSELLLANPASLRNDVARATHYVQNINTAALDAASIVRRLREFYRARDLNEVFRAFSLHHVVAQAVSLTEPKWKAEARAAGVTITIETDLQPIPALWGNEVEIREGLTNLILNAVDAMPDGGTVTIRAEAFVGSSAGTSGGAPATHIVLKVSDTGIGMDEVTRRRCMEPFFTTKGSRGTGLGLPMVYGIVRRHDGTIDIETQLGKGSSFIIRLPIRSEPVDEADTHQPPGVTRKLRILVVDDDDLVRESIAVCLGGDGHTVEVAANGREGLERFQAGWFDLVITDRAMPEMSGDQLAVTIKRLAPHKPVLMITGFGDFMVAQGEHPESVDEILAKPYTLRALRDAVSHLAANSAEPTEGHQTSDQGQAAA